MSVTTFAAPILPGKTDAWKAAIAEITGPRLAEYKAARAAIGITREVATLQETPHGDFAAVFIEGDNAEGALQRMVDDDSDFHTWFRQAFLVDVHGMDLNNLPPGSPATIDLLG
jgi:hypothetical protein